MKTITLVTGNVNKLAEWRGLWPSDSELVSRKVDLLEIQSDAATIEGQLREIAEYKARQAYKIVGAPVTIEDVGAGLDRLAGYPGPDIKHFHDRLKQNPDIDARRSLFELAKKSGEAATAHCVAAYFDGTTLLTALGTVHGSVVEPRGERGFGFDYCFIPEGETRTYAEMSLEDKARTSHRALAVAQLAEQLAEL